MTEISHSDLAGLGDDHIQSTIRMQDYFARFNNSSSIPQEGDICLMYGDMYVRIGGEWIAVVNLPKPDHCLYCGSKWNEDTFHPGTCANCGAGALLGTSNV